MKWYSFRKRKIPLQNPVLYYFSGYNKKTIGTDFYSISIVEGEWSHQFVLQSHFDRAGSFLLRKILNNKDFIDKKLSQSELISESFLKFCQNKLAGKLKDKTNQQLIGLWKKYYYWYNWYSIVNIPPWLFAADKLSEYLYKELPRYTGADTQEAFYVLSAPDFLTYTGQEELACLNFAIELKQRGIRGIESSPGFNKIVNDFFWIPFDYLGTTVWDKKYYFKKINRLCRSNLNSLKFQKAKVLNYKKIKQEQLKLVKKYNLSSSVVKSFAALRGIAKLQDNKKAITTESHYYLQQLFKELASRSGLDYSDYYFLLLREIVQSLTDIISFKKIIKQRKKLSVGVIRNCRLTIIQGDEAKKILKTENLSLSSREAIRVFNEVIGTTGSPGKVVGRVCMIDSVDNIGKFRSGEIIVAPMTSPDYVPIMRQAKAIITNEGGVTCHAAIISRELKIPCVIATKIATQVFKDGDTVEVDATKGVISKIR